ncbi:hypothetical protein KAU15_02080 [candidate division WOR-3 bacterium]|nr:hypothetical protein [candidate division WOR-3 bacterium]
MCEIRSFEELLEKYDAFNAVLHLKQCNECKDKYSDLINILYPEMDMKISIKEKRHKFSLSIFKLAFGFAILFLLMISMPLSHNIDNSSDWICIDISNNDYMEIVDNLDDNEFLELYHTMEENL